MPWTLKRWARKWTGLCMGVLLPLTLSLSRLKKYLPSSLEPSQPSYLAGILLELLLVAAWPYKPYRTGCEGPVQSISARSVHNIIMHECSVGPDHFALVSFTLVVQIRLYFGSDGNRCRLTPSLADGCCCNLQQHTSMALSKIISFKPDRKLAINTLYAVVLCMYTTHTWASAVDRESGITSVYVTNVMLMRGYGCIEAHALNLIFNIFMV